MDKENTNFDNNEIKEFISYAKKEFEEYLLADNKARQRLLENIDYTEYMQRFKDLAKNTSIFWTNENRIFYQDKFFDIFNKIHREIEETEEIDIDKNSIEFQETVYYACKNFDFNNATHYYEELYQSIYQEIQTKIVQNIILIPLPLSLNFKDEINISKNITIQFFDTFEFSDKSELEKYFKKYIGTELNQHQFEKDEKNKKDFFDTSHTILAIAVKDIASKVEKEAPRIVESVYSLIRIFGFISKEQFDLKFFKEITEEEYNKLLKQEKDKKLIMEEEYDELNEWLYRNRNCPLVTSNEIPKCKTDKYYIVYNKDNNSCQKNNIENPIYKPLSFGFAPLLDINIKNFETYIDEFNFLQILQNCINFCFTHKKIDRRQEKWQNAIILFNTAYELASNEKYDIAMILLLTILESLFVKKKSSSNGDKKDKNNEPPIKVKIANGIIKFFKKKPSNLFDNRPDSKKIKKYIEKTYNRRNNYVHAGVSSYLKFYKKFDTDLQTEILGLRPFHYNQTISFEEQDLFHLFNLVGFILILFLDDTSLNQTKKE